MKWWQWVLTVTFLVVFVILSLLSLQQESLTYDEIIYTQEGREIFLHRNFSLDPYNPPFIKELMAPGGRLTTITLGACLLFSVFLVTKSNFGVSPALFALFLLTFEPNLLGNSHYVTLDTGFTLVFFLSYVLFLKMLHWPTLTLAMLLGLTLGATLSAKISAIPYFFLSIILLGRPKYFFLILLIAGFFVWGTYFFKTDVIVVKHDNPNRVSNKLLIYGKTHAIVPLTWTIEKLQNVKVPLGTYISVVKNNVIRSKNGSTESWYSIVRNVFLKTPLPLLLFFALSIRKRTFVFIVPILAILSIASVSHMNSLVRYVLPIYPFIAIVATNRIAQWKGYSRIFFVILICWYALGTVQMFPHFIAYANELAGPREKRYEKFIDSNIDWGQGLISLQKYVEIHKPKKLIFSYFGRDNGDLYGFISDKPWGSYKFEDICAFHSINFPQHAGRSVTAISISNWYYCGYSTRPAYGKENIRDVVGDSILIFAN